MRKLMKILISVSLVICMVLTLIPAETERVKAENEILYEGKSGNLNWSIDRMGTLLITGEGNYAADTQGNAPEWCKYREEIKSARVIVDKIESTHGMFYRCSNLTSLDLSGLNTENVTDMAFMFSSCRQLKSLDLSALKTDHVTDMSYMFSDCADLKSLDLSHMNTEKVTDMSGLFYQCTALQELNLSGLNTENVTDMYGMFYGCESLTECGCNDFNTKNVTDMGFMFYGCTGIEILNLSGFQTQNVKYMYSMFEDCSHLRDLRINNFRTEQVTDMESMFFGCKALSVLDLRNFDTEHVSDMDFMLEGCDELSWIYTPKNVPCRTPLPEGIWSDSYGNIFTELPYRYTNSLELKKYSPGEQLPERTEKETTKEPEKEKENQNQNQNQKQEESTISITAPARAKIKKIKRGKKKVTIRLVKVKEAKGYYIQYSVKKNFKRAEKTYTTKLKSVIKRLKSKKKYYFRVKAYRMYGTKQVLSKKWSKIKAVKTK